MKSLGKKHRYFEIPSGQRLQLCQELEALLGGSSAPAVCAHGLALVLGLRPEEFVGTTGEGEDAHDVYATLHATARESRSLPGHGPLRLRVGLRPYSFGAQQHLLMIAITALPDGDGGPEAARR